MMADTDALTRRFGPLVATHCLIVAIIYKRDEELCPLAYQSRNFHSCATSRLIPPDIVLPHLPGLSSDYVKSASLAVNTPVPQEPVPIISSCPVLFFSSHSVAPDETANSSHTTEIKIATVAKSLCSERWYLDDYFGSMFH